MRGTVSTQDNTGSSFWRWTTRTRSERVKYLLEAAAHSTRLRPSTRPRRCASSWVTTTSSDGPHRRGQPPVDAVFADINMPGLSGTDLARVLGAFRQPPALVFVTGVEHSEAVVAFEVGALDFVTKPINEDRVNEAISRVVDRVRRHRRRPRSPPRRNRRTTR